MLGSFARCQATPPGAQTNDHRKAPCHRPGTRSGGHENETARGKNPTNKANYCDVCVLSSMGQKSCQKNLGPHYWLPDSVQGNRTQSSSKWLSTHLQLQVEKGLCDGNAFHILSLDLTKAYKLLSRSLLRRTAVAFGIPPEVSAAYHNFLGGLRVLSGTSDPVYSTVGVPEGCALPSVPCFSLIGS